ncbi:hypothetical protein [Planctobacterium marinum]|uniref:hypothetical protein n=1 Tax=Planctobacterium marinum TaxID=1631968 RepID=UPI0030C6FBE3
MAIIRWIVIEAFMETILYWSGRGVLKLFSFGGYPKRGKRAKSHCMVVGAFALVLSFAVLFYF